MTDDNSTNNDLVDMDLDTFEKDFFNKEHIPEEKEKEEVEESEENRDDSLEPEEDTDASAPEEEDEDQSNDEGDDEDEDDESEPEEKPQPKKGKKSAQERINEITAERYAAQREAEDLRRRVAELESRQTEADPNQDRPSLREQLPAEAPQPDAVDDKGEPVYALGEFDPNYIRDLTQYTIQTETEALRQRSAQESEAAQIAAAQRQLAQSWAEKIDAVEETIPELRENIAGLATTFSSIEPSYGEYLATTIMESEVGPQIMNYLSQNIGEAQKIVASGPRAATLALGRLEAQLSRQEASEERRNESLVSKAPAPPSKGVRGSGARKSIRPDTENLADFEKLFFKD